MDTSQPEYGVFGLLGFHRFGFFGFRRQRTNPRNLEPRAPGDREDRKNP